MIIQLSSTLKIPSPVSRHNKKEVAYLLGPDDTKYHILHITVITYAEVIRQRGGFPAKFFSIGSEVVELDGPRKMHERVAPSDEILRGGSGHYVSFLMNSVTSCPSLASSVVGIRML